MPHDLCTSRLMIPFILYFMMGKAYGYTNCVCVRVCVCVWAKGAAKVNNQREAKRFKTSNLKPLIPYV
jgi:hypothetical protein